MPLAGAVAIENQNVVVGYSEEAILSAAVDYLEHRDAFLQRELAESDLASETLVLKSLSNHESFESITETSDLMTLTANRTTGMINYFEGFTASNMELLSWNAQAGGLQNIRETTAGQIECEIYEWTEYPWTSDDFPDEVISGFGTWHKLTLDTIDGQLQVVCDEYDESDLSGVNNSSTYYEIAIEENVESNTDNNGDIITAMGTQTTPTFSRSAAISYANQYVGNYSSGEVRDYTYYNRQYRNFNPIGGDCASFVSQCLKAAGLGETTNWYYNNNGTVCNNSSHYANNNDSFSSHSCTSDDYYGGAWCSSTNLRAELNSCYNSEYDTSPSFSDFCLGDIGFFGNGQTQTHSFICVGIGSDSFLINSHNNDRKNVQYTESTISSNRISRLHIHSASGIWRQYNGTYHRMLCDGGCGEYILGLHYAYNTGTNETCLGCGYVGNISVGIASVEDVFLE